LGVKNGFMNTSSAEGTGHVTSCSCPPSPTPYSLLDNQCGKNQYEHLCKDYLRGTGESGTQQRNTGHGTNCTILTPRVCIYDLC
jgi:hypothetical protein